MINYKNIYQNQENVLLGLIRCFMFHYVLQILLFVRFLFQRRRSSVKTNFPFSRTSVSIINSVMNRSLAQFWHTAFVQKILRRWAVDITCVQTCTLPGLIYNERQLVLAGIVMLENANKLQHFEACLLFCASKRLLTQVRLPYESNRWQTA